MGLHDRLRKLERGGAWFSTEPASEWGVPTEIIIEEWERVFGDLPSKVARAARSIEEQRERGEPLDALLCSGGGTDLMALAVSYGNRETVPVEVEEALEAEARSAQSLGEDAVAMSRDFQDTIIGEALEILDAQKEEEGDE